MMAALGHERTFDVCCLSMSAATTRLRRLLIAVSLQAADLPSPKACYLAPSRIGCSSSDLGSKFNRDPDAMGEGMASIAQTVWLAARNLIAALMLLALGVHPSFAQIVAFGASNTAGYGVGSGEAFPARIEALLHAKGYNVSVANAGISGDTTSGMLSRIDSAVPRGTKLVLLAITNYNDSRRGVDPSQHTANAASIVGHIRALGAKVIMVRFSEVPGSSYRQPDGRHLTAQGHAMLAQRLLPQVIAALGRAR